MHAWECSYNKIKWYIATMTLEEEMEWEDSALEVAMELGDSPL